MRLGQGEDDVKRLLDRMSGRIAAEIRLDDEGTASRLSRDSFKALEATPKLARPISHNPRSGGGPRTRASSTYRAGYTLPPWA